MKPAPIAPPAGSPWRHPLPWLKRLARALLATGQAWVAHRAQSRGAALAFYALFSMAPVLVLAVAIAGRMLGPQAARGELLLQLQGLVSPHLAAGMQSLVLDAQLPGSGGWATAIAGLLLVVGATSVFAELKDSLDEVWQQQAPARPGLVALLRTRLLAFVTVLLLTALFLLSLAVNALLGLVDDLWGGPVAATLGPLFAFSVLTALFAVIHKLLPEARVAWGDALAGALFTALLFSLGQRLLGLYLGRAALGSSFGAAGSVAALLVWVYYSAQIFLLGAEFTREFALAFGSLRPDPSQGPSDEFKD